MRRRPRILENSTLLVLMGPRVSKANGMKGVNRVERLAFELLAVSIIIIRQLVKLH